MANDALPLFELSASLLNMSEETVMHTLRDLRELDLLKLPYPAVALKFPLRDGNDVPYATVTAQVSGEIGLTEPFNVSHTLNSIIELRPFTGNYVLFDLYTKHAQRLDTWQIENWKDADEFAILIKKTIAFALAILIVSLATRNIIKSEFINSRHAKGKASKSNFCGGDGKTIYISRTVLEIPNNLPDDEEHIGLIKRPHLRRGHIHTYHVGTGRAEIRKHWIQPLFVNADADYVASLPRYKVCS